jgi:hypothetical protein
MAASCVTLLVFILILFGALGLSLVLPEYLQRQSYHHTLCVLEGVTIRSWRCCDSSSICSPLPSLGILSCTQRMRALDPGECDAGPQCCATHCDSCETCTRKGKVRKCSSAPCHCRCVLAWTNTTGAVVCGNCTSVTATYIDPSNNATIPATNTFARDIQVPPDITFPPMSRDCVRGPTGTLSWTMSSWHYFGLGIACLVITISAVLCIVAYCRLYHTRPPSFQLDLR